MSCISGIAITRPSPATVRRFRAKERSVALEQDELAALRALEAAR